MTVEASAAGGGHTTAFAPSCHWNNQHLVFRLPTIGVEPERAEEGRAAESAGGRQQGVVLQAGRLLHAVHD
jgi:hypothetical protein